MTTITLILNAAAAEPTTAESWDFLAACDVVGMPDDTPIEVDSSEMYATADISFKDRPDRALAIANERIEELSGRHPADGRRRPGRRRRRVAARLAGGQQ